MKKRLGILVGGVAGLWALSAYPARLIWGESAIVFSALAGAICLVPTALTLIWGHWALRQSPSQQLLLVMGGTGVRMFAVLGVAAILYFSIPYFHEMTFWLWVLIFYLYTLGLEMVLLLRAQVRAES